MPLPGHFEALAATGVQALQPYLPGKPLAELERELGLTGTIKLASNENPLGPSPACAPAMAGAMRDIALYPDGGAFALRQALAAHLGVPASWLTLGNGSNDVLVMLAETFLAPGRSAVYSQYAFIVYALAVQAASASARVAAARPASDPQQPLGHDLDAICSQVDGTTRLLFIANPNNPTGTWLAGRSLRKLLSTVPPDVVVVIDEAYAEYVTDPAWQSAIPWIGGFPNLVVTRTFSKAYGLAGLRVGYAVSQPELSELLNRVRQPFNVNAVGQAAAVAALGDQDHVQRSCDMNAAGRERLTAGLAALGCGTVPSQGNFILAHMPVPAEDCYQSLLRAGIIVRPVANYGLENYLRLTVGLPSQVERLLDALRPILANGGRDG